MLRSGALHTFLKRRGCRSTNEAPTRVIMKLQLSGNAPVEVFPFVSAIHREVVLRHHDGESQDIELTPDEADKIAALLKVAATRARDR